MCRIGETDAEAQQRLQGWDSFLEAESADKAAKAKIASDAATAASSEPSVAAPVEKAPVDSDADSGADTEGEDETTAWENIHSHLKLFRWLKVVILYEQCQFIVFKIKTSNT